MNTTIQSLVNIDKHYKVLIDSKQEKHKKLNVDSTDILLKGTVVHFSGLIKNIFFFVTCARFVKILYVLTTMISVLL